MTPHEAHNTIVLALDQATQKGCYSLEQMQVLLQAINVVKDRLNTPVMLKNDTDGQLHDGQAGATAQATS